MAAGEDQPQAVVLDLVRLRRSVGAAPDRSSRRGELRERRVEAGAAAQGVDGLEPARPRRATPAGSRARPPAATARPPRRRPRASPPRRGRSRRAAGSGWRRPGATRRGRPRPPRGGPVRPGDPPCADSPGRLPPASNVAEPGRSERMSPYYTHGPVGFKAKPSKLVMDSGVVPALGPGGAAVHGPGRESWEFRLRRRALPAFPS